MTRRLVLIYLTGVFLMGCVGAQSSQTPQLRVNQAGLSERLSRTGSFVEEERQEGATSESPDRAR